MVKLSRPLDFLVVADHAEALGATIELKNGNPLLMADPTLRRWHDMMASGEGVDAAIEIIKSVGTGTTPKEMFNPQLAKSVWQAYTATAERYNEPGRFTALIGYEWTSNKAGNNLHRVVIFRDGKDKADQIVPFSADRQRGPGKALEIPRFATRPRPAARSSRSPTTATSRTAACSPWSTSRAHGLTREYAETRARLEPVYEVTQIKGDGETHPFLSPNDEFGGYEIWDKGNLDLTELKKPEMLQYEYARSGLELGLKLEKELGINPVQVRDDRLDRFAHLACHGRGGQFLRQAFRCGAKPRSRACIPSSSPPTARLFSSAGR